MLLHLLFALVLHCIASPIYMNGARFVQVFDRNLHAHYHHTTVCDAHVISFHYAKYPSSTKAADSLVCILQDTNKKYFPVELKEKKTTPPHPKLAIFSRSANC